MKKVLLLLSVILAFSLVGCSSDGGSDGSGDDAWLFDSWIEDDNPPTVDSSILKLKDNHGFEYYVDYDETQLVFVGTFSVSGSTVTITVPALGNSVNELAKLSDDSFTLTDEDGDVTFYYRKSAYPAP